MPRRSRFQLQTLDELLRQLRYAPVSARHRLIDAAEALAHDIDPERMYPHEFVIYRITGYRPEQDEEAVDSGAALLADLAAFISRLSETAPLNEAERGCRALSIEDVSAQLNVSLRTVQRYRKQGLIFHYVSADDGNAGEIGLACFEDALQAFRDRHAGMIEKAARYSQITADDERKAISAAESLRHERGWSRHRVARHLAQQFQRSTETMRLLLIRHDADCIAEGKTPLFNDTGPLTTRDARLLERAWQRGISMTRLTRRFGRTASALHRILNRRRADRLRRLDLHAVELATFRLEEADAIILAPPAVNQFPEIPFVQPRVSDLLRAVREAEPVPAAEEEARIAAWHYFRWRAAAAIAELPEHPGANALDAIETDLRCASKLFRRLVFDALPVVMRRIDAAVGRPVEQLPQRELSPLMKRAVAVSARVLENIDPSRGQHLERVAAYAMDRELAHTPPAVVPERAIARHLADGPGGSEIVEFRTPWDESLQPPKVVREGCDRLDEEDADLLRLRYGWGTELPRSIPQIVEKIGGTSTTVARRLRQLERRVRTHAFRASAGES
ncbi:MAG: DNA-binding protein [Phycisphaerales bacterium]|nr:MAG: DNA-binding protein [Phycisphaerales bacterium]